MEAKKGLKDYYRSKKVNESLVRKRVIKESCFYEVVLSSSAHGEISLVHSLTAVVKHYLRSDWL